MAVARRQACLGDSYSLTERANLLEWPARIRFDLVKRALESIGQTPSRIASSALSLADSFSVVEILTVLYLDILQHRPALPAWPNRDRFVLSKISAWPAYACLLSRLGYFDFESNRGMPVEGAGPLNMNTAPGVDFSSTGEGVGLPVSLGMALGLRLDDRKSRVYTLLGNSELSAGMTWEAAERAGQEKLSRLCAVVDCPGPADLASIKSIAEKYQGFGWESMVVDGHSPEELNYAFSKLKKGSSGRPAVVIARTRRGFGAASIERCAGEPGIAELGAALAELSDFLKRFDRA